MVLNEKEECVEKQSEFVTKVWFPLGPILPNETENRFKKMSLFKYDF